MGVITHFHVAAWARTLDTGLLILSSIQATSSIVPRHNNTTLTMQWLYRWLMDNVTQGIGWIRKSVPAPPRPLYPWQPCLFVLCCDMH